MFSCCSVLDHMPVFWGLYLNTERYLAASLRPTARRSSSNTGEEVGRCRAKHWLGRILASCDGLADRPSIDLTSILVDYEPSLTRGVPRASRSGSSFSIGASQPLMTTHLLHRPIKIQKHRRPSPTESTVPLSAPDCKVPRRDMPMVQDYHLQIFGQVGFDWNRGCEPQSYATTSSSVAR